MIVTPYERSRRSLYIVEERVEDYKQQRQKRKHKVRYHADAYAMCLSRFLPTSTESQNREAIFGIGDLATGNTVLLTTEVGMGKVRRAWNLIFENF